MRRGKANNPEHSRTSGCGTYGRGTDRVAGSGLWGLATCATVLRGIHSSPASSAIGWRHRRFLASAAKGTDACEEPLLRLGPGVPDGRQAALPTGWRAENGSKAERAVCQTRVDRSRYFRPTWTSDWMYIAEARREVAGSVRAFSEPSCDRQRLGTLALQGPRSSFRVLRS